MVRLSAGRESMSDELQALCFAAGANSIFYGEKLLTTGNPDTERDRALFARLGLRPMPVHVDAADHDHAGTRARGDHRAPAQRPEPMPRIQLHRARRSAARAARGARTRARAPHVTRRDGVRCAGRRPTALAGNFCSNDYLGLAQQFAVVDALQDARRAAKAPAASPRTWSAATTPRTTRSSANSPTGSARRARCCSAAATWPTSRSCRRCSATDDVCVQDKLNHASLIDAARLSGCKLRRYPHARPRRRAAAAARVPDVAALLATDGVFSMDGDVAPLRQLALAARVQQALLYVDDAHGVGVLGPRGSRQRRRGATRRARRCRCSWRRWARRSAATARCVRRRRRPDPAPGRNRAPVPLHHRVAAGAGRGVAAGGDAGAQGPLAPRKAARAGRALPRRRRATRLGAAAVGHADPAAARAATTRARSRWRSALEARGLLGRRDPSADGARRQRAPAHHPVGAAHAGAMSMHCSMRSLGARGDRQGRSASDARPRTPPRTHDARRARHAPRARGDRRRAAVGAVLHPTYVLNRAMRQRRRALGVDGIAALPDHACRCCCR